MDEKDMKPQVPPAAMQSVDKTDKKLAFSSDLNPAGAPAGERVAVVPTGQLVLGQPGVFARGGDWVL